MDASWGAFLDILEDKAERAGYLSERLRRSPVVLCGVENALRAFFTRNILDQVSAAGANKRS